MKTVLKRILPRKAINYIKAKVQAIDKVIYQYFALSEFLSSLYYLLFSKQFRREHYSVLAGRRANAQRNKLRTNATLRRNIHRLEKGLIMRPLRSSFAEAYILETVEHFCYVSNVGGYCSEEFKWANDVLFRYFSSVIDTEVISKARAKYNKHTRKLQADKQYIPYPSFERTNTKITTDELFKLFKRRRSVRWFQDKLVDRDKIESAIDMALQAPSACNRQPYEFHVSVDPKIAAEVSGIAMGTAGFSHNIKALIVVVGDLSAYSQERDRHLIYIDSGLVSMQIMLALETMGLASCPINWPDIDTYEIRMSRELNLEPFQRPVMLIAVGYADEQGQIPYSQKKKAADLMKDINSVNRD